MVEDKIRQKKTVAMHIDRWLCTNVNRHICTSLVLEVYMSEKTFCCLFWWANRFQAQFWIHTQIKCWGTLKTCWEKKSHFDQRLCTFIFQQPIGHSTMSRHNRKGTPLNVVDDILDLLVFSRCCVCILLLHKRVISYAK